MKRILECNVDDMGFGGVYSLVRNVILSRPEGVKMDIACIEPFEKQEHIDELAQYGCDVHYVGANVNKIKKQFAIVRNLTTVMKAGGYDAVHIHGDVAYKLLTCAIAARKAGVKKIILHSHASGTDGNHREVKKALHMASRRLLKYLGTEYVSCSDLAADWMFPNVRKKRITIIHNGVDLDRFHFNEAVRKETRKQWNLCGKFVLGHVGRFEYQKNHEYLVEVFRAVKEREPNAVLFLVGEGSLKEDIQKKVAEYGLADSVIFAGLSSEVEKLFWAMDVFVLPSHFEGLPIVGVEAQATGLPVVFSDRITKEAKLTHAVTYLPIGEGDIPSWADTICAWERYERHDPYEELKAQHFSLEDTYQEFVALYK